MEILKKIEECKTIPQLDEIRMNVVKAMESNNGINFEIIQKAFIKQKNKLVRIPLKDRNW